jgi:hypothetical protein
MCHWAVTKIDHQFVEHIYNIRVGAQKVGADNVTLRICIPTGVRLHNMHLFVQTRQQKDQLTGCLVETVETLQHKTPADLLNANRIGNLCKQEIDNIHLLTIKVCRKVESAVARHEIHLTAVLACNVPKIVNVQNVASTVSALFNINIGMVFQKVCGFFPTRDFVVARIFDRDSIVLIVLVVAIVQNGLDETTRTLGESKHLDRRWSLQVLKIEHIDDLDHFEIGARNRLVLANACLVRVCMDVFVRVRVLFVDVPVIAEFFNFVFDFGQIVIE